MKSESRFPRSLVEFNKVFATEDACRSWLEQVRWPDGFLCPRCGASGWRLKRRALMECRAGHQVSLTAGTAFHRTRKPLRVWFLAILLAFGQKTGVSAKNLQRLLALGSYETAWTWLHKLRSKTLRPGRELLSGRVEVDEAYFVGNTGETPKGSRARGWGHPSVAVAAEVRGDGIGRVRLERVADARSESLVAFVTKHIGAGSTVTTDGACGYRSLPRAGYEHEPLHSRPSSTSPRPRSSRGSTA